MSADRVGASAAAATTARRSPCTPAATTGSRRRSSSSRRRPGVDVEFLTGNDAELRERIAAEGEDTEADVYLTVDAGNLWAAAEDGIFQPLESTVLDESIPAELRDEQNRWFGLAVRARTIVYNTDLVDAADVPTTYEELADQEYEGRLCLRNANNDYQQSLVASMIAADGEEATVEVLEGWARNAEIFANDVALLDAMAAGACEIGVVNHYYLARLLEEHPDAPIGLLWAEQDGRGVHVNISGGGVTRYADDIAARPAVPRVAGDRRPGHARRRQPRVPGEPGGRGRAPDPRARSAPTSRATSCAPTCSARSTPTPCAPWTPPTSAERRDRR